MDSAAAIAALPEPRRSMVRTLDALIRKAAPRLAPHLQGGLLAYGPYHYKYASGREGDWAVILLASKKSYASLYVCAVAKDGSYVAETYKKLLPKADIGKSCIRIKRLEDVDLKVLSALVKEAAALGGAGAVAGTA